MSDRLLELACIGLSELEYACNRGNGSTNPNMVNNVNKVTPSHFKWMKGSLSEFKQVWDNRSHSSEIQTVPGQVSQMQCVCVCCACRWRASAFHRVQVSWRSLVGLWGTKVASEAKLVQMNQHDSGSDFRDTACLQTRALRLMCLSAFCFRVSGLTLSIFWQFSRKLSHIWTVRSILSGMLS